MGKGCSRWGHHKIPFPSLRAALQRLAVKEESRGAIREERSPQGDTPVGLAMPCWQRWVPRTHLGQASEETPSL